MDVPPPWEDLHIDMVTQIVNRLPCAIDLVSMAAVCKKWREKIEQVPLPPLPPRLPWLLLEPADATGVYCYLSGCRDHNRFPGPRHFGSYDGGWLFLADGQTRGHRLLNIRTGESHALPDLFADDAGGEIHSMVVLAATLSSPLDHQDCLAAGIVTYQPDLDAPRRRHFAFWLPGHQVAVGNALLAPPVGPGLELEDVVYYGRSFHFLTQGGHILVCTPILDVDGPGAIPLVMSQLLRFQEVERTDEQIVRARYLVASRGELLMAVRLAPHHHHEPTTSFKVFQMAHRNIFKPEDNEEEADEYRWTWSELPTLGGRLLFVGRGCSRSYEVTEYPWFKDGIFFLDDRSFYDDEMMFRGVNERQYPCSDIGRWSPEGPPPMVDLYFPERVPSYNSPPAWLLP